MGQGRFAAKPPPTPGRFCKVSHTANSTCAHKSKCNKKSIQKSKMVVYLNSGTPIRTAKKSTLHVEKRPNNAPLSLVLVRIVLMLECPRLASWPLLRLEGHKGRECDCGI